MNNWNRISPFRITWDTPGFLVGIVMLNSLVLFAQSVVRFRSFLVFDHIVVSLFSTNGLHCPFDIFRLSFVLLYSLSPWSVQQKPLFDDDICALRGFKKKRHQKLETFYPVKHLSSSGSMLVSFVCPFFFSRVFNILTIEVFYQRENPLCIFENNKPYMHVIVLTKLFII